MVTAPGIVELHALGSAAVVHARLASDVPPCAIGTQLRLLDPADLDDAEGVWIGARPPTASAASDSDTEDSDSDMAHRRVEWDTGVTHPAALFAYLAGSNATADGAFAAVLRELSNSADNQGACRVAGATAVRNHRSTYRAGDGPRGKECVSGTLQSWP